MEQILKPEGGWLEVYYRHMPYGCRYTVLPHYRTTTHMKRSSFGKGENALRYTTREELERAKREGKPKVKGYFGTTSTYRWDNTTWTTIP